MVNTNISGIYAEGQILCRSCAERIYGNSLVMYITVGDFHKIHESVRPMYASKGLLCDDCSNWIFPPDQTEDPWWLVEPDPEEHLRLLAPFADLLETLQIDALNLRNIVASRP